MHEILNDPINVRVDFTNNKVRPRLIKWGSSLFAIHRVNFIYQNKEGEHTIFYFSVSNNQYYLKLKFNPATMQWNLMEIYGE
ncbi:hypothetical protein D6827_03035 [Candidatus Parcubacteria bacterium]|nr:MAG: hypothetical protein D6827_03035 [Candidatus Parcubacteria bacterium]